MRRVSDYQVNIGKNAKKDRKLKIWLTVKTKPDFVYCQKASISCPEKDYVRDGSLRRGWLNFTVKVMVS